MPSVIQEGNFLYFNKTKKNEFLNIIILNKLKIK